MSPYWILSKPRTTPAMVLTTGAIRRAKLQSNRHHQRTNTQLFCRPDALPVTQPTVINSVRALKGVYQRLCLTNKKFCQQTEVICVLSKGDISNDFDGPLAWFSRSQHFWSRISRIPCVLRKSFYRTRYETEWYHFQWPWVTSDPDFTVTTFFLKSNIGKPARLKD